MKLFYKIGLFTTTLAKCCCIVFESFDCFILTVNSKVTEGLDISSLDHHLSHATQVRYLLFVFLTFRTEQINRCLLTLHWLLQCSVDRMCVEYTVLCGICRHTFSIVTLLIYIRASIIFSCIASSENGL